MFICPLKGKCWILDQLAKCTINPSMHERIVAEVRETGNLLVALEREGIPPFFCVMLVEIVMNARMAPRGACATCGAKGSFD
jgi:hypothetical protein